MHKQLKTLEKSQDYKNLIDLQAVHSAATQRIAEITASLQEEYLALVDDVRIDYAAAQQKISEAEAALELLARSHPEWFGDKRGIKTPYGTVKFHTGTSLDVPNEEVSILLIEEHAPMDAAKYLRTEKKLNLEALSELTDEQLKALRINRIKTDNFSVKAATIDLGKAVKQAEEKEAA